MQTTSATWKALWAAGARLETRATIAGTVYTQMANPIITRALTQGGMSIGNAVSATLQLSILASASIPRAAEVALEMRLTDGTTESEWLPAGTYYIARRQRDAVNGVLTLQCYDALLRANAIWTPSSGSWPRTMAAVADELAAQMGVTMDSRTRIGSGGLYRIAEPRPGQTIRDTLRRIALANGGNWIVTPAGRLRLVPLVSASDAAAATVDAIDVSGITGSIDVGAAGTVTGVRYGLSDDAPVILGDDTGIVIDASVGAHVAAALYEALAGHTHQAFALTGAVYDPAVELGDYVRAGANGEIASVLYSETAVAGALFHGSIAAPETGETDDEYPYIDGASAKALSAAKVYAAEAVAGLDAALDQAEIFNRLTDGGAAQGIYMVDGQLYVNMSYARSGALVLGGSNNQNGVLRVLDANGNAVGTWNNGGITLSKGSIDFDVDTGVSGAVNTVRLNAADGIASYLYALALRYRASANATPVRTLLDRGAITIEDFVGAQVRNNPVAIRPGRISMDQGSNRIGTADLLFSITGNGNYNSGGYSNTGAVNLFLRNGRIYMTHEKPWPETGDVTWFDLDVEDQTMKLDGSATFGAVSCGNGATGSFTTADGKTVTVTDGIVTAIA